jgi:glycosyltransferase involved in cell wall biosynthesis
MIVFDINIDVFQELYMAESRLPRRVLYQYQVPEQARRLGWKNEIINGLAKNDQLPQYRLVRRVMFPGWFCTLGCLTMPILARSALKHCREFLGGNPEIGVFYNPYYLPMQRALKPNVTVYHPIDDYTIYWPKRAQRTLRLEAELIRRSDLIICTGKFMVDEFRQKYPHLAERIHHIPNPVTASLIVPQPLPRTLFRGDGADPRRPVLGYVGKIQDRLNEPVIVALARALPWADIVLAPVPGEMEQRQRAGLANPFAGLPNVHIRENVPKAELVALVRSFDVCLLPQVRSHNNDCASPRKLFEYFATSRPIVALNTPEAALLEPFVHVARSGDDFIARVKSILTEGEPPDYPARRIRLAWDYTATPLANRYADLLGETCAQKGLKFQAWA